MKTFEIWMEGFMCTGMDSPAGASCEARGIKAENFREAVRKHYTKNGKLDSLVNLDKPSYWGCRLYPTEAEARKSFG